MTITFDRIAPAILVAAAVLSLGSALASQYVWGLQPCILCLYQRWPWGIVAGLGILGLVLSRRARAAVVALAAVALAVGTGIAVFHVGVEQAWWEGPAACAADFEFSAGASPADMRAQLLAAPLVRCDVPAFTLFGVSMAGYNALFSVMMAVAAAVAARRLFRETAA